MGGGGASNGNFPLLPTRPSAQFAMGRMTFPTALRFLDYLLTSVTSGYARFTSVLDASSSRTREETTTLETVTVSVPLALVNTIQYYVTIQTQTSILHLLSTCLPLLFLLLLLLTQTHYCRQLKSP